MMPNNMLLPTSTQDKVPSLMDTSTALPEGSGKSQSKNIPLAFLDSFPPNLSNS